MKCTADFKIFVNIYRSRGKAKGRAVIWSNWFWKQNRKYCLFLGCIGRSRYVFSNQWESQQV